MEHQFEEFPNDKQNPYAPPQYEAVGFEAKPEKKNPWQYFIGVFKKYAVFQGRARRAEYWCFSLFKFIFSLVFQLIDLKFDLYFFDDNGILSTIWNLFVLLPSWGVTVRRMHDCDKSGWYMLIPIYNFILCCSEGTYGKNNYGPDPKWEHANAEEKTVSPASQNANTRNCPFCTKRIEVSSKFCSGCGNNVHEYDNEQKIKKEQTFREKYKNIEDIFNDESIMKEAKELRRIYGKRMYIFHLKSKAREFGFGEIEINENDVE